MRILVAQDWFVRAFCRKVGMTSRAYIARHNVYYANREKSSPKSPMRGWQNAASRQI
jgi:hypothetical protein